MITKEIVVGLISILENGMIQVREDTVIIEDGVELSRTYHREQLEPGQDVSDMDNKIQLICKVVWTPEIISAFEAEKAAKRETVMSSSV